MQILHLDAADAIAKLRLNSEDDLWFLFQTLEQGDRVRAKTTRREEGREDVRSDKGSGRQVVTLTIEVEKVEFATFAERLRLLGTIRDAPASVELGAHHTINLEAGDTLTLQKLEWRPAQMALLKEAEKLTQGAQIWFLSLEDDNALLATLHPFGLKNHAQITRTSLGKYSNKPSPTKTDFFDEILLQLRTIDRGPVPLIVVGPGFTREEFLSYAAEPKQRIDLTPVVTVPASQAGRGGINEVLRSGSAEKWVKDSHLAKEIELIDRWLTEIAKDGLAAYGREQVVTCLDAGAVDTLLVSSVILREGAAEELMEKAQSQASEFVVVSEDHEGGEQLVAMGSLGAILRYRMT